MALLEVKDLEVSYGVIKALKGISFEVNEGEIVTLIGANGAGKTTTMQSVIGLIPKNGGSVIYDGQDISKHPCHKIVHLGMSQVPEGRRIFQELTVYENLLMGAYSINIENLDAGIFDMTFAPNNNDIDIAVSINNTGQNPINSITINTAAAINKAFVAFSIKISSFDYKYIFTLRFFKI